MGLKWRFALQISLPIIIFALITIVSSLLYTYQTFDYIIDHVTDEMKRAQIQAFYTESRIVQETVSGFFLLSSQPVIVASDLRRRILNHPKFLKSDYKSDQTSLNAKYYEQDYYSIPLDPVCNCSYNHSSWYINDEILTLEDLKLNRVAYSHFYQSSWLKSVLSPFTRVKYSRNNSLYVDYYMGYYSGLSYLYPIRYQGYFTNYDCKSPSDICSKNRECTHYEVQCRYWYNQTLINGVSKRPSLLVPCQYNNLIFQESCMSIWDSSDTIEIGSMCIEVNTDPFYDYTKNFIHIVGNSVRVSAYVLNFDQTVIYHPDIKQYNQTYYFTKKITDVEYPSEIESSRAQKFQTHMKNSLDSLKKYPNHRETFDYVSYDNKSMTLTLLPLEKGRGTYQYVLCLSMEYDALTQEITNLEANIQKELLYEMLLSGLILSFILMVFMKINHNIIKIFMNPFYDLADKLRRIEHDSSVSFMNDQYNSSYEIHKLYEVFEKFKTIILLQDINNFRSFEDAINIYTHALKLFEGVNNTKGIYYCCYHLGLLYVQSYKYTKAAVMLDRSVKLSTNQDIRCNSLYNVTAGLITAYLATDLQSLVHMLLADIHSCIPESELVRYLLLECDYRISQGYPIHNFLSILKDHIHDPINEFYKQKYFYYKGIMYKYNSNYKQSLKCMHKALTSSPYFDPHLRISILQHFQEIYEIYSMNINWVNNYILACNKKNLDVVIISALSYHSYDMYIELVNKMLEYREIEDRYSFIACNELSVIFELNGENNESIKYKFSDKENCVLYDSIADALRIFQYSSKEADKWVIILNTKIEKGSTHSISNLLNIYSEMSINYLIFSNSEIYGIDILFDSSVRNMYYTEISEKNISEGIRYLHCMRAVPNVSISEKCIYTSYLY